MKINFTVSTLLSRITIDADKDMNGKSLTNLGNLGIGANALKSTDVLIKEGDANTWYIRDVADTGFKNIKLEMIELNNSLISRVNGGFLQADDVDGHFFRFFARDTGVGQAEVAYLQGAADPYFKFVLPPVISKTALPGTPVDGHIAYDSADGCLKQYQGASWVRLSTGLIVPVRKTADETVNNSSVLQADDELKLNVGANEIWILTLYILQQSVSTTANIKFGWTVPAASSLKWGSDSMTGTAGQVGSGPLSTAKPGGGVAVSTEADSVVLATGNFTQLLRLTGIYIGGANAGTVNLTWAQLTATIEDTKILTNSILVAQKIG